MRLKWMLVSLVAVAVIAGCGGGNNAGGDIVPFTMPLPSDAVHENFRADTAIQLFYPAEDYDSIVAFFDDWTASEPETYERFDRTDPTGVGWVWLDDSTAQNRTIDIEKDFDGGNNFGIVTFVQVVDEKTP